MEYFDTEAQVEQADSFSTNLPSPPNSQIVVAERGLLVVEPKKVSQLQIIPKLKSRQSLLLSLLCIGAVTALFAGALRWRYALTHEATNKAYVATDTYAVNSRIPGQVVSVIAAENQVVKKGSVLVKLDPSEYQTKVKVAQTTVQLAQQQVKTKKANVTPGAVKAKITNHPKVLLPGQNDPTVVAARTEVKNAQSELKRIEPAFVKTELDYERFVKLQQSGFIPLKTLEENRAKYDSILKQHNSSIENFKLAQAKLTTARQNYLDGQIKLAQQKIEKARKDSTEAQTKLKQKLEQDSKNILEAQTKLQQKLELTRKNFTEAQTKLKQEIEQKKAEQQYAKEVKANERKAEKLKVDYEKGIQQLENKLKIHQEQQNKSITKLTEQKTVVVQQAASELQLLDYSKSQLYLKTAQTALKQAQVQLKDAQYKLYYTKITAPNTGQINIKRAQTGQKVEQGQTLMSLVPQKPWIAADFDDEQLKRIKPGQPVQIQLKALTDKTFTGKVQSVLSSSKTKYHLRPPVKILFDSQTLGKYKSLLTPGTPASVKVEI